MKGEVAHNATEVTLFDTRCKNQNKTTICLENLSLKGNTFNKACPSKIMRRSQQLMPTKNQHHTLKSCTQQFPAEEKLDFLVK